MEPNIHNNQNIEENNFLIDQINQKDNNNNIDSNQNPNMNIINLKKKEKDSDFSPVFKNSIHFMKKKREKPREEKNVNILNKNELPEIHADRIMFLNDEIEKKMNKNIKLEESIQEVQTELNNLNFKNEKYEKIGNYLENFNVEKENKYSDNYYDKIENEYPIFEYMENPFLNMETFNDAIINENNNDSNKMDEEMDPYSFRILTDNLNYKIFKGEKEASIEFIIENNGKLAWPEKETFLLLDESKSSFKIEKVYLFPLQPQEKCFVYFKFKNSDNYKPGLYKNYFSFNVKGEKFGNDIIINIEKF